NRLRQEKKCARTQKRKKCRKTHYCAQDVLPASASVRPTAGQFGGRPEALSRHAVAALVLGLVEVLVGPLDEGGGVQALVPFRKGGAGADGKSIILVLVLKDMPLQLGAESLGHFESTGLRGFDEDHAEFVAAVAGKEVLLADLVAK